MSEDPQYAPTPEYGSAPSAAGAAPSLDDELSAPPQMSVMARLGNIFFGPGDVFEDVRRSPRGWWLPIIVLLLLSSGSGFLLQYKLNLTPETLAAAAVDAQLEQQGKTRKDLSDQEKAQVEGQEKFTALFFKFGPIVGVVFFAVFFAVVSLIYWLILMIAQAKTTFLRVLSVVAFSYFAPNLIKLLLQVVYTFLVNPENVDPKAFMQSGSLLTTSLAFLVSAKEHAALWTFLNWIDVFSIWFLVLLGIGFGAISLKRKKFGSTFPLAVAPYALVMLLSVGFRLLLSR
jgi:hypothetical protein